MFKNTLGYIPKAVENIFITNSDKHKYNTRNRDKMHSAYVFLSVHKVLVYILSIYFSSLLHFCLTLYIIYCLLYCSYQSNSLTMFKYLSQLILANIKIYIVKLLPIFNESI